MFEAKPIKRTICLLPVWPKLANTGQGEEKIIVYVEERESKKKGLDRMMMVRSVRNDDDDEDEK